MSDIYDLKDPKRSQWFLAGWIMGDLSLYKAAAKAVKGDVAKLREAAKRREFEGDILNDGSLSYGGVQVHWKDLAAIPGSGG